MFWRKRKPSDFCAEVEAHLELEVERLKEQGMNEEEARAAARRNFGNVTRAQERFYESSRWMWWDNLRRDVRYGLRQLRRNPGFTIVAVLTLALGIGANTAIFSVVNTVILRSLPYQNPDRLVQIEEHHEDFKSGNFTYANFVDLHSEAPRTLESIAAYRYFFANLSGDGRPERLDSAQVSAGFFHVLGIAPFLGRTFTSEEDQPGGPNVVVLSHALWQRRFDGDTSVLGRKVTLNASAYTVIGVMPPGFNYPGKTQIWAPLLQHPQLNANRHSHLLGVIGRLAAGATLTQASTELGVFARRVAEQNPGLDPGLGVGLSALEAHMVAPVRPALLVLLGAVGIVLLIACANVSSLALARSVERQKEWAVRAALGAGRNRLLVQSLAESGVLALAGGLTGLAVAAFSLHPLTVLAPAGIPHLSHVRVDLRVLFFTLGVSLAAGVFFGLPPAFTAFRNDPNRKLNEGARGSASRRHLRFRSVMVISEVGLALVLLTGAGLLVNSFTRLIRVDPGFSTHHVLTANLFLSTSRYPEGSQRTPQFLGRVLEKVRALPGVVSAGVVSTLPLALGPSTNLEIASSSAPPGGPEPWADIRVIDTDYFKTVSIPLLGGRAFTRRDRADSPKVMIVSQAMARSYWPGQNPLGRRVTMKGWGAPITGVVVGVVGDVKSDGLAASARPTLYWPYTQFPVIFNSLVVRTSGDPLALAGAVESQVWSVDPEQAVSDLATLDSRVRESLSPARFNTLLLGAFALLAGVLAAVGIYGIVAYSVTQRVHEIGIRMALGAEPGNVLVLVVRHGLKLTMAGVAIGLVGALGLTRFLSSLLYGVTPTDPLTFVAVCVILIVVALLACYIPARRATKVDPVVALRYE